MLSGEEDAAAITLIQSAVDPVDEKLDKMRLKELKLFVRDRGEDCNNCNDRIAWLELARKMKNQPIVKKPHSNEEL
jgi:hypothetical protein